MQKIDDTRMTLPPISVVCYKCKHLESNYNMECKAFNKIPEKIWLGENKHREPYPNDNGIRFEPLSE